MELSTIKRKISNSIKELDPNDYVDICVLIKSNISSSEMISETPRGTFIDLDKLDENVLKQLDNMIATKMQRIAER